MNIKWNQAAYLVPFLLIFAVACGPAQPKINVPTATSVAVVSANPTSQAEAGTRGTVVNVPTTGSTPIASTDPSSENEARPNAFGVLAETTLVHNGFRTEVSGTLIVATTLDQALSAAGGKQAVTVSLRNLSQSTSNIQSRATINFAPGFDNFVVLPTVDGPLTLYLNRNGTLDPSPDTGRFTWPDIFPSGSALTFSAVLPRPLSEGSYSFTLNLATVAPNPIQITVSLDPPEGG